MTIEDKAGDTAGTGSKSVSQHRLRGHCSRSIGSGVLPGDRSSAGLVQGLGDPGAA